MERLKQTKQWIEKMQKTGKIMQKLSRRLKCNPSQIKERVLELIEENKRLENED